MALDNLISISFTDDEQQQLINAVATIEKIMGGKSVNLSTRQRQSYGRVRYEMEVWITKVSNYMQSHGNLVPSYVDMAEHTKDLEAHNLLNPLIDRVQAAIQGMLDTNLLLGSDLYNNSMAFYRSVTMAAKSNAIGAASVYADLRQQFPGPGSKSPSSTPATGDKP